MSRKWTATAFAIASMWVAVLFIAIFAPELETRGAAGDTTTLPLAGIVAAAVVFIATIVVAAIGLGGKPTDPEVERERLERERLEVRLRELEARVASRNDVPQAKKPSLFSR